MEKSLKKSSTLSVGGSHALYDFSDPIAFNRAKFGIAGAGDVQVYAASLNVAELEKNFVIYEEIPNVQDWPISKLIQRELDRERTRRICDDYLLGQGDIRYFPPLTAVLIPTNNVNLPVDRYLIADNTEEAAIRSKVLTLYEGLKGAEIDHRFAGFAELVSEVGADSGLAVWNKQTLSAVIIDGQHRYKALMAAKLQNKDFAGCKISVNLIDLSEVSARTMQSPTAVARTLFITINNTPIEVDEARLVLMDDRDAISTFTQVLVDDSDGQHPPAIPPELIDWRCDGGKHDSGLSLSGVLTLRGIINTAIFANHSISSLDDRTSQSRVKNWKRQLELWIRPDAEITAALDSSHTIQSRYDQAVLGASGDLQDDDESPFLFSYSTQAAKIIRTIFQRRYLPLFRYVYAELQPYAKFQDIAGSEKAFQKKGTLHIYLRAFRLQREELGREKECAVVLNHYKDKVKYCIDQNVLYTVMGQKAIFQTLFEEYLAAAEDIEDSEEMLGLTQQFTEQFNFLADVLTPSANFTENFFSIKFRPSLRLPSGMDAFKDFWKGLIIGVNGELDYSKGAVGILKSIIAAILSHDSESEAPFVFRDRAKIVKRHGSMIEKIYTWESEEAKSAAEKVVLAKEKLMTKLLKG